MAASSCTLPSKHPDGFDGEQVTWLVEQINDLDPPQNG